MTNTPARQPLPELSAPELLAPELLAPELLAPELLAPELLAPELLARYDAQLRAACEMADAPEVTRIGPLWAASFPQRRRGFISYAALPPGTDLAALVAQALTHYTADERIDEVEWKTRGHDQLPGLVEILQQHGFRPEEQETVMAGPAEAAAMIAVPLPDGFTLHRAGTDDELRRAEALAGRVFGDDPERSRQRAEELVERRAADPDSFEMWFVTDAAGEVACSGRVDFVAGSDFAGLWGGACEERHRGQGLYRAVTAARARSALAHGKRFLHSDCTQFSRPILERAGLVSITTSTPVVWRRS